MSYCLYLFIPNKTNSLGGIGMFLTSLATALFGYLCYSVGYFKGYDYCGKVRQEVEQKLKECGME